MICLLIMAGNTFNATAQQDDQPSMYMFSGLMLNPGYAGSNETWTTMALYRTQWRGFDGAPEFQFVAAEGALLNKKMGLGFILHNEKLGVTKQTELLGNYAYHVPLSKKIKLGIGIRGGLSVYRANVTELLLTDYDDFIFETDIDPVVVPKIGAGLYMYSRKFFLGLSAHNLMAIELQNAPNYVPDYFLSGGYAFEIGEDFVLRPTAIAKFTAGQGPAFDINLNALLFNRLWLGVGYYHEQRFAAMLEVLITKQLRVGYAYEFTGSECDDCEKGTHEVLIGFDFNTKISVKTPRYF